MVGIAGQVGRPVVNRVSLGGLLCKQPSNSHREILQTEPGAYLRLYPKDSQGFYS